MRWLAVVLVLVLAPACASKPACPVTPVAGTAGPPFLWKVQGKAGVVWLYGTLHSAGLEAVPPAALDALAASKRVATELGNEQPDDELFRTYAWNRHGQGLEYLLPEREWDELRDALRGKVKEYDLRRAQPWYAMSQLTRAAAPPGKSMDVVLVKRAEERELPIDALDTWDGQLKMLSKTVTLADLRETIQARKTLHCAHARMRASYAAGDTEAMTALLVQPARAEEMLYVRNRAWLPALEKYLEGDGAFVAVGLGHMLGEQGLPALLAKAGYVVTRAI